MYDDLVKRLRYCSEEQDGCGMRALSSDCVLRVGLITQAADAIEELQRANPYLKAYIAEHDARIEEIKRHQWIPVMKKMPKYGERCLVFGGVTMYVAYYDRNRYGGESWHKLNSKSHYCNPTHWMPLPEPPKEET